MTIEATLRQAGPFAGNGVTTSFPFTFQLLDEGETLVVFRTDGEGVDTPLVLNGDYSVAVNVEQEENPGGSVTYPLSGSPLPTGQRLTVRSALEQTQGIELTIAGGFSPTVIERGLDKLTAFVHELQEQINRSLRGSGTDDQSFEIGNAEARANKYVYFDADGAPTLVSALTPGALTQGGFNGFLQTVAESVWSAILDSWVGAALNSFYKLVNPRTAAEITAGRVPTTYRYAELNVLRYGADRTGTNDSSTAFHDAIAVVAVYGNGTVIAPSGKYKVNLDITTSNFKISGGRRAYTSTTVGLYPNNNADWVVDIGSVGASTNDWAVENISIHGHGGGDLGLRIRNCRNWSLRDVDIIGFDVTSFLVTSTAAFGTAYGDLHNVSVAASIAGAVGARFESGTGYCTAIRIANSDFHSTAGTSWAVQLDATGGSDQVSLTMTAVWIECGDDRGVQFVSSNTEIVCMGVDIDSSNAADSLVTIPTNSRIGDYLKGMVRIDGVVTTSAGDTAAVSARWHMPNETFLMFPQVQGALNFQDVALGSYQQHVSGLQNQRISRTGASLDIRSTDGDVRLFLTTAAAGGALRLAGAGSVGVYRGTGTPEGAVSAPIGSLFLRENGGAATTLYVKESGVSNTGWVAK